jgi:SAM-dependent methyltransferase
MTRRIREMTYVGVDLNPKAWQDRPEFEFHCASADALPFPDESFDAVVSMFVIEHLVFPSRFLDEAWRVLRRPGRLLTVAPDFRDQAMASERIGTSYGSGREKLKRGRILDALLTAFDTRFRIPRLRQRRLEMLQQGKHTFPVLTTPRCLRLPGFVPDCDAVYPVCPEELIGYLRKKPGFSAADLFYRGSNAFGLVVTRK